VTTTVSIIALLALWQPALLRVVTTSCSIASEEVHQSESQYRYGLSRLCREWDQCCTFPFQKMHFDFKEKSCETSFYKKK